MTVNKNIKRYICVYSIFLVLVALDIVLKIVTDGVTNKVIIDGVVSIQSEYNKGAAWSMFSSYTFILAILSVVFVIMAIIFDIKNKLVKNNLYNVSFILILSGAFGNAIDRVFLGFVRDFIKLDFVYFPIFNLADMLLVIGVILLAVYILLYEKFKSKGINSENNTGNK